MHGTALALYPRGSPHALFARFFYGYRFSRDVISHKGAIEIYGAVADLYTATER
jgi:hypothetical protein